MLTSKKRRGVARASLTRFAGRLKDLESQPDDPNTATLAQQNMLTKLESLDRDFKTHHFALIDLDESDELMVKLSTFEQNVFDYSLRLKRMLQSLDSSASPLQLPLIPRV